MKKRGRPKLYTDTQKDAAASLYLKSCLSYAEIGKQYGMSGGAVARAVKDLQKRQNGVSEKRPEETFENQTKISFEEIPNEAIMSSNLVTEDEKYIYLKIPMKKMEELVKILKDCEIEV